MIMKLIRIATVSAMTFACISAVPASEPSTAPSDRAAGAMMPRTARLVPRPGGRVPTEEDVRATLKFTQENMPNLHAMWETARPRSPRQRRLGAYAIREYRRYEQARENDPDGRAEAVLNQIREMDTRIFGLLREYHDAAPDQQDAIREQLRQNMREVVVDMLQERERRIARLRQMLQREERALESDREKADGVADERVQKLLSETLAARAAEPTTGPSNDDETQDLPGPAPTPK